MTRKLPPTASVAAQIDGAKMYAPAAERNADALCMLLRDHAPQKGKALELASGTGQHVAAFARSLPGLTWQPTEFDPIRLASINAYAAEADLDNIAAAQHLDATRGDWSARFGQQNLIVLINLTHLITTAETINVVTQALRALVPGGKFVLYGPFMRAGQLTSDGDARFHAQLSGANPAIGYKDDTQIEDWLRIAGATDVQRIEMPANNIAFIATR